MCCCWLCFLLLFCCCFVFVCSSFCLWKKKFCGTFLLNIRVTTTAYIKPINKSEWNFFYRKIVRTTNLQQSSTIVKAHSIVNGGIKARESSIQYSIQSTFCTPRQIHSFCLCVHGYFWNRFNWPWWFEYSVQDLNRRWNEKPNRNDEAPKKINKWSTNK